MAGATSVRMLSAGRMKFTLLTAQPADPANPTVTELQAGLQVCDNVPADADFTFGAADSETVDSTSLCSETKSETYGQGNYEIGFALWRRFLDAGGFDPIGDAAFEALKVKGTTFWAYGRLTDKKATEDWASDDEIFLGVEAVTDTPRPVSATEGFIAYTIPSKVQRAYPFTKAKAAA